MRISQKGIDLIKKYEGIIDGNPKTVNLDPYLCPAGYWTIGWGHVVKSPAGQMLHGASNKSAAYAVYPNGITRVEAEGLLRNDTASFSNFVRRVAPALNQNQHDALVSFAFNLGNGNLKNSSLLRKVRTNPNDVTIAVEFVKWVRAGGRVLDGLVARRVAEAMLYFSHQYSATDVYQLCKTSLLERGINLDRIHARTPIF